MRTLPISLCLAAIFWLGTVLALFSQSGAASWIAGFAYIVYDTALILFIAMTSLRNSRCNLAALSPDQVYSPSIAIMVTARNEAHVISECLTAICSQTDRPDEVLWIDDGSTDRSLEILEGWKKTGRLNLRILARAHSGKAAAMNAGWPTLLSEIAITLDADTFLAPGATAAIRSDFARKPRLAVTGGLLEVRSYERPRGLFERFQRFEYMRSFVARDVWAKKHALNLISGAFAAYRCSILNKVGGFDPTSRVEDYELTHRIYRDGALQKEPWEVEICLGAQAITDVPGVVTKFLKQRERWFAGFIETHWQYRDLVGNPKFGNLGRWMLPIKSCDMFQPLFGLTAFAGLMTFVYKYFYGSAGSALPKVVVIALSVKIFIDLVFHYYSVFIYHRWQGIRVPRSTWLSSTISTFLEPISFQLLRHIGALLGWLAVMLKRRSWHPGRS